MEVNVFLHSVLLLVRACNVHTLEAKKMHMKTKIRIRSHQKVAWEIPYQYTAQNENQKHYDVNDASLIKAIPESIQ